MPGAVGRDSGSAGAGGSLDGSSEAEPERAWASRRREEEIGGSEAMTWALFYLVCFLVGVTLSVLSFLGGSFHLPHFHLRSEEHTSELQSLRHLVCRLLLEK